MDTQVQSGSLIPFALAKPPEWIGTPSPRVDSSTLTRTGARRPTRRDGPDEGRIPARGRPWRVQAVRVRRKTTRGDCRALGDRILSCGATVVSHPCYDLGRRHTQCNGSGRCEDPAEELQTTSAPKAPRTSRVDQHGLLRLSARSRLLPSLLSALIPQAQSRFYKNTNPPYYPTIPAEARLAACPLASRR